ncbi:PEP-CTERM sorting domain-containing protein [Piscinibacter sp. Jin2]|uniref:PEP-CTERM sorting domain-containing protein n=2 Tax=Aquariibacter lacus TaxID=2801332 RepID=A0A9X0XDA8_9BURK|nr:PEP-CTERM sorting domain-containing protein [Piscinibacter lacus]
MANEGDAREDEADERRGSAGNASIELVPEGSDLSRLILSNVESVRGDLVTFGGRSFSIRDTDGQLVYDSGDLLDREAIARGLYDDGRSDNKGVEPEGVALLDIEGRTFAFIGLERTTTAATAVFDITDPTQVSFIDFIVGQGDRAPEGLTGFKVGNDYYLAVANEAIDGVAGTTSLFQLSPVPEPSTYALMAGGLLALGAFARRRKA